MHIYPLTLVQFAFATEPTNTTALQNTNTFINCEVDGTEIINITWIAPNGLTITRDFSHISIVTTSSSTRRSSSLQFANVQMSQSEGWYTCICFSYNGTTENIISLTAGAFLHVQGTYICMYVCMLQNINISKIYCKTGTYVCTYACILLYHLY